ncbi:histidine kinase [uncultured Arcticibacterium sp.]|uniref:sensor histidine kinase n=1 Tax=uncultured Arcticibacterium sp. TaxID=2173042 RepID=UPI0030FC0D39
MEYRLSNLTLFFFGLLTVSMAQENTQIRESNVYIEKVEISGRAVPMDSILQTDYYHNNLKVFFGNQFTFPNTGRYRLFNPDVASSKYSIWNTVDSPEINIYNLPAGTYEFQFMDVVSKTKTTKTAFILIVNRPWYSTWWFWALGFVCLFTLLYGREKFLKSQEEEEKEQQKKIVDLELRTLQLQMNPHFIFNALNSIQSYVMSQDTVKANDYLTKFAHLIRMFLDSSRNKYISIDEEITLLQLYVEMENLRFENKFDYQINVDPNVDKMIEIPTMVLQPFIENSINHGLRYKENKGFLEINFTDDANFITCTVIDDGVGRIKSKGIQVKSIKGYKSQGLKITQERLKTYNKINNSNIQFSIDNVLSENDSADVGTVVIIRFPKNME